MKLLKKIFDWIRLGFELFIFLFLITLGWLLKIRLEDIESLEQEYNNKLKSK